MSFVKQILQINKIIQHLNVHLEPVSILSGSSAWFSNHWEVPFTILSRRALVGKWRLGSKTTRPKDHRFGSICPTKRRRWVLCCFLTHNHIVFSCFRFSGFGLTKGPSSGIICDFFLGAKPSFPLFSWWKGVLFHMKSDRFFSFFGDFLLSTNLSRTVSTGI